MFVAELVVLLALPKNFLRLVFSPMLAGFSVRSVLK